MSIHIEWGYDLPPEIRQVVEPYVMRYLDVLPDWCIRLKVLSASSADPEDGDLNDCVMAMAAEYKYRKAKLFVHTDFLNMRPDERELTVIHEFVHVLNAPLVDFTDQLITIVDNKAPDAKEMLEVLQGAGMEAATEDTATLIWRLTADRR